MVDFVFLFSFSALWLNLIWYALRERETESHFLTWFWFFPPYLWSRIAFHNSRNGDYAKASINYLPRISSSFATFISSEARFIFFVLCAFSASSTSSFYFFFLVIRNCFSQDGNFFWSSICICDFFFIFLCIVIFLLWCSVLFCLYF